MYGKPSGPVTRTLAFIVACHISAATYPKWVRRYGIGLLGLVALALMIATVFIIRSEVQKAPEFMHASLWNGVMLIFVAIFAMIVAGACLLRLLKLI